MEVTVVRSLTFKGLLSTFQVTSGVGSPIKSISTCKISPALMRISLSGVLILGATVKTIVL